MANFNPGLNPTGDPDYERVGNVDLVNVQANNRAANASRWDSFFKTASQGIKLADKSVQEASKEDVKAGYEGLNQKYGLDADSTLQGEAVTNPSIAADQPPKAEQSRVDSDLRRIQAAYDQGKFSQSRYYAELENIMKGVKSRYPGYSDIIDKQVENVTGVTPANALAKARMNEFNALQSQATEKLNTKEKFVLDNADELTPAQRSDLQSGKMDLDTAVNNIQNRQGEIKEIQRSIYELNLKKSRNELTSQEAEKGAGEVTYGIHRMAMEDVSTLASKAKEAIDKGTYDPAQYGLLLEQTKLAFQQKAMQAVENGVGNSLPFEKKQKLISDAVANFDNIAKVFTSKDSGMLDYLHSDIEAMKNKDLRTILNDPSAGIPLRAIQAAQSAGGPQVAGLLVDKMNKVGSLGTSIEGALTRGTPSQKNDPVSKTLTMNQVVSMGTSVAIGSADPLELIKNLNITGKDSPFAVTRTLGMWRDSLTDPKFGDQWQKNSAATLFSSDNKEFLTKAFKDSYSRGIAYGILTSPEVTTAMQKLKGTPEYENYKEWTYNGYIQVLKDSTHRLSAIVDRPYLDLKFNEENGHFDLVPSKLGLEAARKYGASGGVQASVLLEKLLGKGISEDVRRLNSATDNVSKVLEGDKYRTPEQLKNLVASLAMSTQGEKKGVWTWMAQQMMATEDILKKNPDNLEFGGTHPNFTKASGTDGEPRSGFTSLIESGDYGGALEALKGVISRGESGEDYNRLVNKGDSSEAFRAPLTGMTVGEVLNYQRGMKAEGHLSSASGKYQIIRGTLQSLVNEGVVSTEDKFDKNTQEKAAEALLKRRGLDDYLKGRMPLRSFLRNLGDEWEIIKVNKKVAKRVASELQTLKDNQIAGA